jgi:microcystin-dependent protein
MPTVTGYTAEFMDTINDSTVVDGNVVGNDLILVTRDGTEINAGNVRGPTGPTGPSGEPPPGVCYPWLGTNAPANHVLMYGQTIANAQTLYPALWTNVDPTWKSGVNLIVPDLRGRIPVGKDNMGGGAAAGRITSTSGINGTVLGASGGDQRMQNHVHPILVPESNTFPMSRFPEEYLVWVGSQISATSSTGAGNSQNVQPSIILNWILKVQ